ncbi:hypothetical protein BMR1_03g03210 [Babesia microti strain RI]|uniref:Uncharacterized protein n=1 Tax=Babesia microti (strain RI) TaxID=1133968 RepID=A0A0K3ANY9_BABMR|nr:hypothetical protein BMR1_03g03210 [Babesia microti strain RI]CTQ41242.1 hypothetical protein BMR1_03g03210 [Babesia microti strain RI]|eukprot:XP_012649253.1 hypothetical protein BMR1_03g03210 [Babesia microti strain RI]
MNLGIKGKRWKFNFVINRGIFCKWQVYTSADMCQGISFYDAYLLQI